MKYSILIILLQVLIVSSQAKGESSPSSVLLEHLNGNPTKSEIDSAGTYLWYGVDAQDRDTLVQLLRMQLTGTHRLEILDILSNHPLQEFDYDLAIELRTESHPISQELYRAVKCSGGIACCNVLKEIISAPSSSSLLRARAVKLHYYLDMEGAAKNVLETFLHHRVPDNVISDSNLVSSILFVLRSVGELPELNTALLETYELVTEDQPIAASLTSLSSINPSTINLDLGSRGSVMEIIYRQVAENLKVNGSPFALDILANFMDAGDSILSAEVKGVEFKQLSTSFGLIDYNSHHLREWLIHSKSLAPSQRPSFHLFDSLKLSLDISNPYFPSNVLNSVWLLTTDTVQADKFGYTSSQVSSIESSFARSLMTELCSDLGISHSGNESLSLNPFSGANVMLGQTNLRPFRYATLQSSQHVCDSSIASYLCSQHYDSTTAIRIGRFATTQLLRRYSLVAYATLCALRSQGKQSPTLTPSNLDRNFDSLSAHCEIGNHNLVTKVVRILKVKKNAIFDQDSITAIEPIPLSRTISFDQNLYLEEVVAKKTNGSKITISWMGSIPLEFLDGLRKHPRLLDFTNTSLAVRELKMMANHRPLVYDLLDLVRCNPQESLPMLMRCITDSKFPWNVARAFIQSAGGNIIAAGIEGDYGMSTQGWRPFVLTDPKSPIFPFQVALSNADYTSKRDAMRSQTEVFFSQRVHRLTANRIILALNNLPDEVIKSPVTHWDFLDGLIPGNTKPNPMKWDNLKHLRDLAFAARDEEASAGAWNLDELQNRTVDSVILVSFVINPNFVNYSAVYNIRAEGFQRFIFCEGPLGALGELLKRGLEFDPAFLTSNVIDVAGITEAASDNFTAALLRTIRLNSEPNTLPESLQRLWLLPDRFDTGIDFPVDFMSSPESRIWAARSALLRGLRDYFQLTGTIYRYKPQQAFVRQLFAAWQDLNRRANAIAEESAAPAVESINQQVALINQSIFSLNATLDLGTGQTAFTATISYNGLGLSLLTDFSSFSGITGQLGNLTLPTEEFSSLANESEDGNYRSLASESNSEWTRRLSSGEIAVETSNSPIFVSSDQMALSVHWNELPPLVGPVQFVDASGLAGLIVDAYPGLTVNQQKQIAKAFKDNQFPKALFDRLIEIRNAVREEEKLASGEWIRTSIVENLIPPYFSRSGRPVDPTVTEDEWNNNYMKDFNSESRKPFDRIIERDKGHTCEFCDGLPAFTISYGENFKFMRWTFTYRLKDGSSVSYQEIQETPFSLVPLLKQSPTINAHILEKISYLAASAATGGSANPARDVLDMESPETAREARQFMKELSKTAVPVSIKVILDPLTDAFTAFIEARKKWEKDNTPVLHEPFVPSPCLGTPVLNFMPPPWESAIRRDEPVMQVMLHQRAGSICRDVESGGIQISVQQFVMP